MAKRRRRKKNNNKKSQNNERSNSNKKPKNEQKKEISAIMRGVMDKIETKTEFQKISPKIIVDDKGLAYDVANDLKDDLSYTQLRNFYAYIKNVDIKYNSWDKIQPELYLLKPRLASKYVQGNVPYRFYKLIELIINKIDVGTESDKMESFKRFVQFFEATVAFHKYLGGE